MDHIYTNLVLSGGGPKGIAYVGLMRRLREQRLLEHVKNLYGTSIGAWWSVLFSLVGMDEVYLEAHSMEAFDDICQIGTQDVLEMIRTIVTSFGLNDGSRFLNVIAQAFHHRFGSLRLDPNRITFLEWAKLTGYSLNICVTNITKCCSETLSIESSPDMPVFEAIRASIAIPILFQPVFYKGQILCDGAIFQNIPLVPNEEQRYTITVILGEAEEAREPEEARLQVQKQEQKQEQQSSFMRYAFLLGRAIFKRIINTEPKAGGLTIIVHIDSDMLPFDFKTMSFIGKKEVLESVIQIGYDALSDLKQNIPITR